MRELTKKDLDILEFYAGEKNRELYWNYLAHLPGNDGYGLLALGVVRNDNVPGQVANAYAQGVAQDYKAGMTERDWEAFGIDLMQRDFAKRKEAFQSGDRQAALNLPAEAVTDVHDKSFENMGIDKSAWTPRILMDMAENKGGTPAMQGIWSGMLDNQKLGLYRGTFTLNEVRAHTDFSSLDSVKRSLGYVYDMSIAYNAASKARPNTDPDVIGSTDHYYRFDRKSGTWTETLERNDGGIEGLPATRQVTDQEEIKRLNDTRELRLQRQDLREQFHPDDTYRKLARTPQTLADLDEPDARDTSLAAYPKPHINAPQLMSNPSHPDHALYGNVEQSLRAQLPPGAEVSEDRLSQITLAAKEAGFDPNERINVVVGESSLHLRGEYATHTTKVDLTLPVPSAQDSALQAAELDLKQSQQTGQYAQQQAGQKAATMQRA